MKRFFRSNGFLILLIAALLAVLLAVGSVLSGGNLLSSALSVVTTPFRKASAAAAQWVEERYDRAFRYDALEQANEELRQRVAELEKDAREGEDALRQNERYRDLLGLKQRRADFVFEEATVTQHTVSNWTSSLVLNKGERDDVALDDCVVDQYGNLVGVVTAVDYNSCTVSTVLDPEVEMGARVAKTDENAILEGDFALMEEGRVKLSYLPEGAALSAGDQVTTSGLGDIYPAGLVVGVVESLHTEPNGLDRYAVVRPAADLAGVRYVFVIKDFDVVE